VRVESGNEILKLLPKQIFQKISGAGTTGDEKTKNTAPDWRSGESSFESIPFYQVMQEFERQYDVSITTRNVDSEQLFTGTFTHSDLSLALKSIAIPLNLTYEVEGKKIILASDSQ
jgi:ferric-dicitrate binding protein FerR (iron transport regulator)